MPRRRVLAFLAVVCVAALGGSAVALARSSGGDAQGARHHHAQRAEHAPWAAALDGVARRLDVSPAGLRAAVKAVAAEQRGQTGTGLAARKTAWIDGVAAQLGKAPDAVAAAVRAELDAQLTKAVAKGWIAEQGKTIALGCFDNPAGCDLKALRAQIAAFGTSKHAKQHRPCHKRRSGDGRMTPGGRSTSAPLT